MKFSDLIGKTLREVIAEIDEVIFRTDAQAFRLHHRQDCCEHVYVEDINGDIADLINTPILVAEEVCSSEHPDDHKPKYDYDSFTWTFYRLATIKGWVIIRFLGTSNGYYSETVDFEEIT